MCDSGILQIEEYFELMNAVAFLVWWLLSPLNYIPEIKYKKKLINKKGIQYS